MHSRAREIAGGNSVEALVIYDSVFGNTKQIAQAITDGLAARVTVEIQQAADADPNRLAEYGLLVLGSPTRGFRPTEGVTGLLKRVPSNALKATRVAAFDTRLKADEIDSRGLRFVVKTGGYAAKRIGDQLKRHGGRLVLPPEGFYVQDTEGPLKQGELERAGAWAIQLLQAE